MLYMGIDQSLRKTGIIIINEDYGLVYQETFTPDFYKYSIPDSKFDRCINIGMRIRMLCKKYEVNCAALEGYAYAAKGNYYLTAAELGAVIKTLLKVSNVAYKQYPPKQHMKHFKEWAKVEVTGNKFTKYVAKEAGYLLTDDHQSDALSLAIMIAEEDSNKER